MIIEVKVPSPGESITEVEISEWLKKDGEYVYKDEDLCEIDSDKATLTINAEADGRLKIMVETGEKVEVGTVVCTIDTDAKKEGNLSATEETPNEETNLSTSQAPSETKQISEKKETEKLTIKIEEIPSELSNKNPIGQEKTEKFPKEKISFNRNEHKEKTSPLRKKIAQRLVAVKNEMAMLTTFNEIDMSAIIQLRNQFKTQFKETHGVGLGFMSFFTKAASEALALFPIINASLDGDEIIYHDFVDMGIAVSAPKGLMVPVIRNAESLSIAEIEQNILNLADKARDGKLSLEEMSGGTFTITNGGVFGSMLSTPIINPPQSAILGMHNIVDRPVAINGKVEIRPIMYVALSYDHRLIDGKDSVGFLVKLKEILENPIKIMYAGKDPFKFLLGI